MAPLFCLDPAVLDLAPADSEILAELAVGDPGADVTLSPEGEAACQRYAARASGRWSLSGPLAR